MGSKNVRDRRRYPRIERRAKIVFEASGERFEGVIVNFSEVGLLIHGEKIPDAGTPVTIPLKFSTGKVYRVQGVVKWSRKAPAPSGPVPALGAMGVELAAVPIDYLKAVADMRKQVAAHSTRGPEERYDVYHRVQFKSGDTFLSEYTENLSRGGMYLATDRPLKPGSVIRSLLEIPGFDEPVEVEGRVAYTLDAIEAEERGRTPGVGVQFINLTDEARTRLNHYIQRLAAHRTTPERRLTAPVPTSGSLNDSLVPELLLNVFEQESTGVLRLRRKGVEKRIYFRNGRPVFVESSLPSESLAQYLARRGMLPLADIPRWFAHIEKGDARFAMALVREGMMDRAVVLESLVESQEERVTHTFPWFDGTFEFSHGTDWGVQVAVLPLQVHRMVFDGVLHWYGAPLVAAWMGLSEHSVMKSGESPAEEAAVLPPLAHQLIGAGWIPQSLGAIAEETGLSMDTLLPAAYALVISGHLSLEFLAREGEKAPAERVAKITYTEIEPPGVWKKLIDEDYERLKNLDYFELLGLPENASDEDVTEAFLSRTARYSRWESGSESKVSHILSWIRTARDTLLDSNLRQMYVGERSSPGKVQAQQDSFEVEHALLVAMSAVQEDLPDEAVAALAPVVKRNPNHPQACGWHAWALFLSNRREHAGEAGRLLDCALDADPADPQLHFFRGKMHAHAKNWKKAEQAFLQTLRLQANHAEARNGLREARLWMKHAPAAGDAREE